MSPSDFRARLEAVERRGHYGPAGRDLIRTMRQVNDRDRTPTCLTLLALAAIVAAAIARLR